MEELLVISASRRTDLVGCYPEAFLKRLKEYSPELVHSLVIWTKNPQNMILPGPLKKTVKNYRQIYVHLTITGMGGGEFEPRIPPWQDVVGMIDPLVDLVQDPRRISWRFDPILEVEGNGITYSNFDYFPRLLAAIAPWGIKSCRVSWVSPYKKVIARLAGRGWHITPPDLEKQTIQADQLRQAADRYGISLHFCCMGGFPISRCIDGGLLSELHPDGLVCSREKARGQRERCGCTHSVDIGWYSLRCQHGCLYCYAIP